MAWTQAEREAVQAIRNDVSETKTHVAKIRATVSVINKLPCLKTVGDTPQIEIDRLKQDAATRKWWTRTTAGGFVLLVFERAIALLTK